MNNALGPSETATTHTSKSIGSHTYERTADFKNIANIGKIFLKRLAFVPIIVPICQIMA